MWVHKLPKITIDSILCKQTGLEAKLIILYIQPENLAGN